MPLSAPPTTTLRLLHNDRIISAVKYHEKKTYCNGLVFETYATPAAELTLNHFMPLISSSNVLQPLGAAVMRFAHSRPSIYTGDLLYHPHLLPVARDSPLVDRQVS